MNSTDSWIARVRAADAEAEACFDLMGDMAADAEKSDEGVIACALIAIAAELRAQRIARRSGAGQSESSGRIP